MLKRFFNNSRKPYEASKAMKQTTIEITGILPIPAAEVWQRLGEIRTLQTITRPYAAFTPLGHYSSWEEGGHCRMKLRLFGLISPGVHTIRVVRWDASVLSVPTHEGIPFVPLWNHEIRFESMGDRRRYTDRVPLGAGWKTPFVRLWSIALYRHRQRK